MGKVHCRTGPQLLHVIYVDMHVWVEVRWNAMMHTRLGKYPTGYHQFVRLGPWVGLYPNTPIEEAV